MDLIPETSEIVEFYKDFTIFLTGGTGFLGKLFIEKLLRTCPDVKRIYLLVRPKKGKDVNTRFEEIFSGPNFDPLFRIFPNFTSKVHLIEGDCSLTELGINEQDKQILISEVNCVIHCAATVRFDEKLRNASHINVRSVQEIINLCREINNLKAALYISTAFSNCIRKDIDETFYEPPLSSKKLFSLLEALEDDQLDKITPIMLGDYPNTYVYTKAIAEDLVRSEGKSLPIAVFRPSIVIATVKEPIAGWIDNLYGATGVLIGAALGVLRSIQVKKENVAELVPADYVINGALAALWEIGSTKKEPKCEEVTVYNYVSSAEAPLRWEEFCSLAETHAPNVASPLLIWHYFFKMRPNRIHHLIAVFFYHTIPAYIIDFMCLCIGKKPMLVKGYKKINKFADVIGYFGLREWTFTNKNIQKLWKRMSARDQELFEFSMKSFDWEQYFITYVKGARVYLLKDPMETLSAGKRKYYKLMIAHYALIAALVFFAYKILILVLSYFFIG